MHSTTTPSTNACVVSGRWLGREGSIGACESERTNPPARMAGDRASHEGKKPRERTHRGGAETPKARERTHRGGEDLRKARERSHHGPSGADLSPRESTKTENSPCSSRSAPRNRWDSGCAGCARDNESSDSPHRGREDKQGERNQKEGFERLAGLHRVCRPGCVCGAKPTRGAETGPRGGCDRSTPATTAMIKLNFGPGSKAPFPG